MTRMRGKGKMTQCKHMLTS